MLTSIIPDDELTINVTQFIFLRKCKILNGDDCQGDDDHHDQPFFTLKVMTSFIPYDDLHIIPHSYVQIYEFWGLFESINLFIFLQIQTYKNKERTLN